MKLPTELPTALGPIEVVEVEELKFEGKELMGMFQPLERRISIRTGMHDDVAIATLLHEWVHAILWDAGVHLKKKQEEAVCDALSTTLAASGLVFSKPNTRRKPRTKR